MALSPVDRSALARIAANTRWSVPVDRAAATAAARANGPASLDYWLRKVDPEGALPYADAVKAAESRKKAYFERLALLGRRARAAKAAAGRSR